MADDNPAKWERLLQVILRFGEPEEIDRILRDLGTPAQVIARNEELAAIIESRRRSRWFLKSIREAAVWIAAVGGALTMLYGASSLVLPLFRDPPPQQQDNGP